MSNEQKHSPQHQELLKKQELEQNEVKEVLNVIRKYAVPVAIVIVSVCAYFLVNRYFVSARLKKEAKADALLVNAMGPEDYETILDKYGSTPSAPIAMLNLAMSKFSDGDYDAAQELYKRFLKKHDDHEMALQAELNAITCREAKGEYSEAHLLYGDFIVSHATSYLAPVAMLRQAGCLEAMGNPAEAVRTYEDLVVNYPGSSWANLAETKMSVINSKLK